MANWYGTARSNRFVVNDYNEFNKEFTGTGVQVERIEDTNEVLLLSFTEDGGWPTAVWPDDSEDHVEFDIASVIQNHIHHDSCAVLMEVGNEKMRYVTGVAQAITHKEVVTISLSDIYQQAELLIGRTLDTAEY